MEQVRAEITLQVQTRMELRNYTVKNGNTIEMPSANFIDEGFSTGDAIFYTTDGGTNISTGIASVSPTVLVITGASLPNGDQAGEKPDFLRNIEDLDGLRYKFNLIDNNGTTSFISLLDQTLQSYQVEGLRAAGSGVFVAAEWLGSIKGSQTGIMEAAWIQDIADGGENGTAGSPIAGSIQASIQEFKIRHTYHIGPFYLQNEQDNIRNLIRPDRLSGGIDLKHIADFELRTTLSNPNTAKTGRLDWVLGRTNYFGENYGDDPTQYTVENVLLTDLGTGLAISKVKLDTVTRVSFSVMSANSTFQTTHPLVCYHSYLPDADVYSESTDSLNALWQLESVRQTIDAAAIASGHLTNFAASLVGGNEITVTFDLTFTASEQAAIAEDGEYLIAVQVADDTLSTDQSDKTILPIQLDVYETETAIPGLMAVSKMEFYTEPMTFIDGVSSGFTSMNGWIQDGFMVDWRFGLDLSETAVLESLEFKLVAFNVNENKQFEIDRVNYDLSGQTIIPVSGSPTDVQAIEIDRTRGFALKDGNQFNFVKMSTDTNDGTNQFYDGQTSFKADWQTWLELADTDPAFYDPSLPFNGLNKQINRFSGFQDYEIKVLITACVSQNGTETEYEFKSPDLNLLDFDEQDGTPIVWTRQIETEDESGANLGGKIMKTEDTLLRFIFTPDIPVVDPSLYWGMIRIEPVENPGKASICQLSTVQDPKDGNILIPLVGETKTKLCIIAGVIYLECLVDHTKLDPAKNYNIYGRMGLVDQAPPVIPTVTREIGLSFNENNEFLAFQQPGETMPNLNILDSIFDTVEGDLIYKWSALEPGGDATIKGNWTGIGAITLAVLETFTAANSTGWIYVESNDSSFVNAGVILEYDRLGAAVQTNLTILLSDGAIDTSRIIAFKNNITIQSINYFNIGRAYWDVRTANPSGEDYTQFQTDTNDGGYIANLQASIDALTDEDPYSLHVDCEVTALTGRSIVINYTYTDTPEKERALDLGTNFKADYRDLPNSNNCIPFDESTEVCDLNSSISTFFDNVNQNQYTMEFLVQGELTDPFSINYSSIFHNQESSSIGIAVSLIQIGGVTTMALNLKGPGGRQYFRRIDANFITGQKMHCVITQDPTPNGLLLDPSSTRMFLNGRELLEESIGQVQTLRLTDATPSTSTTMVCAGFQPNNANPTVFTALGPSRIQTVKVYNGILTPAEVWQRFQDPNFVPVAGVEAEWDFSNPTTSSIPELTATHGNGTTIDTAGTPITIPPVNLFS